CTACYFVLCCSLFFFFFFQAEDGIRDLYVTGVQTCALPISTGFFLARSTRSRSRRACQEKPGRREWRIRGSRGRSMDECRAAGRSEERRVGKEWRYGVAGWG